jgi:hypothetical protein
MALLPYKVVEPCFKVKISDHINIIVLISKLKNQKRKRGSNGGKE